MAKGYGVPFPGRLTVGIHEPPKLLTRRRFASGDNGLEADSSSRSYGLAMWMLLRSGRPDRLRDSAGDERLRLFIMGRKRVLGVVADDGVGGGKSVAVLRLGKEPPLGVMILRPPHLLQRYLSAAVDVVVEPGSELLTPRPLRRG